MSTQASTKARAHFEAEAQRLLETAELDRGSFWFCDRGRVDLAHIQVPLAFDASGVALRRGVECVRDRNLRKAAWSCQVKQNRVLEITTTVDGRLTKLEADLARDVDAGLARAWIVEAFRAAPGANSGNFCGGGAPGQYLEQFMAQFVRGTDKQLFVSFRDGVPAVMRAESEVRLQPTAQDTGRFEYRCWTIYETL